MADQTESDDIQPRLPIKKASKKGNVKKAAKPSASAKRGRLPERPFPRVELEEAIKVAIVIRDKNGGNPWQPDQVRDAVDYPKTNKFYYLTAAARDFGLTEGSAQTDEISLTDLGRRLAYAQTSTDEEGTRREAFFKVSIFRDVLDHYKGSQLPEMKYLRNTLEGKFHLDPAVHDEFADLFRRNCEYLKITEGVANDLKDSRTATKPKDTTITVSSEFVTVAEPEEDTGLVCFVAMPFTEKHDEHQKGFFSEVLKQIIAPAGRRAGFRVITARKEGSDVIHATIINGLLDADLVVVDLTEHNPNVLFELGVRMAEDKPVAIIRAAGTKPIFDVDHLLRVEEYSPCLWPSTVEYDLPKISAHISGAWNSRDGNQTYMKILRNKAAQEVRKIE